MKNFYHTETHVQHVKLALKLSEDSRKYVVGQEWVQTCDSESSELCQAGVWHCELLIPPPANSQIVFPWIFPSCQTSSTLTTHSFIQSLRQQTFIEYPLWYLLWAKKIPFALCEFTLYQDFHLFDLNLFLRCMFWILDRTMRARAFSLIPHPSLLEGPVQCVAGCGLLKRLTGILLTVFTLSLGCMCEGASQLTSENTEA